MSFPTTTTTSEITASSVFGYGLLVLNTHSSSKKAELTLQCADLYKRDLIPMMIPLENKNSQFIIPDIPARPKNVKILDAKHMPSRGKCGSIRNHKAMIHSFCNIESYAIDLSWDILLRYYSPIAQSLSSTAIVSKTDQQFNQILSDISTIIECLETNHFTQLYYNNCSCNNRRIETETKGTLKIKMPMEFYEDWLRIASEEAFHFTLWAKRLKEMNSFYGEFPVHSGFWNSAQSTNHCLMERLAIVHIVLEGRGLDVTPFCVKKLQNINDRKSVQLLNTIINDEITHVGSGVRWFKYCCELLNIEHGVCEFHRIVRRRFNGRLKKPFNVQARNRAGLDPEWYLPLS